MHFAGQCPPANLYIIPLCTCSLPPVPAALAVGQENNTDVNPFYQHARWAGAGLRHAASCAAAAALLPRTAATAAAGACVGPTAVHAAASMLLPPLHPCSYVWVYPEVEDWGEAYDDAARAMNCTADWRSVLKLGEQWLGGIKSPGRCCEQPGSAGILIFFRWGG